MTNPVQKYIEYRKERKYIRDSLSLENDNFW